MLNGMIQARLEVDGTGISTTCRCIRVLVLIIIRRAIIYGLWTLTSIVTSILKMET